MKRKHRGTEVEVTATIHGDDGDDLDVLVTCSVAPGEPDHYDRSIGGPGGWSPGCGPEVEILSLATDEAGSRDVSFLIDSLSKEEIAGIEESAIEQAGEDDAGRADDAADAKYEAMRDARYDRD